MVAAKLQSAPASQDLLSQQYVLILEKTNEQLSHWVAMYSSNIAWLGLLVAVLALAAVVIVYWIQNRTTSDFKKKMDELFEAAKSDSLVQMREYRKTLDALLEDFKSDKKEKQLEMKEAKTAVEQERIKKELEKIDNKTAVVSSLADSSVVRPKVVHFKHPVKRHTCTECKKDFFIEDDSASLTSIRVSASMFPNFGTTSASTIECPYCHNQDYL